MTTFNRSKSFNQKALGVGSPRSLSFGTSRINRSSSVSHCLRVLVVIGSLFSFFIAIGGGYIYVLPSFTQAFHGYGISKSNDSIGDCNVFDGNWIVDNSYPLYNASECPFVEQGFNCLGNGRKDEDYLKWRWKPKNCDIPRGCYFQVGNALKLGMSIPAAFRMALDTWALWVQNTIDTNRTRVFFRTFEPSHWSDQTHRFCNVTRHPMSETEGTNRSLFSDATWEVVKKMTVPVTILHITAMSAFRSDAHVGKWNDNLSIADCSHWCLPGVPICGMKFYSISCYINHRFSLQ
ncbi:hypothetical protein GH714_021663 [Hevea brasiliensis]|uniref:Trichome birefringence-like C-terminal domain-containing protein n=1 Tax=Hevea brasiliensis TaxID=3981 RepID=A0A6A6KAD1_HEVBR|nr:hypothetical protein GH714_021663 [Hevea brasiliensis]